MKKMLVVILLGLVLLVGCSNGITKQRELAETQYSSGDIDGAIGTYETIVALKNKTEDIVRLKELKVEKYRSMAENYYEENDFINAIDLYNKLLELNENVDDRNRLTDIKREQEEIALYNEFEKSLNTIKKGLYNTTDIIDLAELMLSNKEVIDKFQEHEFNSDTGIGVLASKIKEDDIYQGFLEEFESDEIVNAVTNTEMSNTLDKVLDWQLSSYTDAVVHGAIRDRVDMQIDLILALK